MQYIWRTPPHPTPYAMRAHIYGSNQSCILLAAVARLVLHRHALSCKVTPSLVRAMISTTDLSAPVAPPEEELCKLCKNSEEWNIPEDEDDEERVRDYLCI